MTVYELVESMKHYEPPVVVKELWRLPGVPAGKCCECGKSLMRVAGDDGIFCQECRQERDKVARRECDSAVRALGIFPHLKAIESAVRWISQWKTPERTLIPGITQNTYKMIAYKGRKAARVPASEARAAKATAASLTRLVKTGSDKAKTAYRKQMQRFCAVIGATFTPSTEG